MEHHFQETIAFTIFSVSHLSCMEKPHPHKVYMYKREELTKFSANFSPQNWSKNINNNLLGLVFVFPI
jgi:hypothetical protein